MIFLLPKSQILTIFELDSNHAVEDIPRRYRMCLDSTFYKIRVRLGVTRAGLNSGLVLELSSETRGLLNHTGGSIPDFYEGQNLPDICVVFFSYSSAFREIIL